MSQSPEQLLDASHELMAQGSPDSVRASMMLLKASSDVSHATLVAMFEKAQKDLINELVRLKNNDLVSYHIDAAMARVKTILDDLRNDSESVAETLIHATIILGRCKSRLQVGNKELLTAFDFIGPDDANVRRLVEQLVGHIDRAAICAEQSIRNQLQAACIKANMSEKDAETMEISANFPPIESTIPSGRVPVPKEKKQISIATKKKLKKSPIETAKELSADAYKSIAKMRQSYLIGRREADIIRQRTLATVAQNEAMGGAMCNAQKSLVTQLMNEGLVAFVDRSGRKWTLGNYCEMAVRTTSRQSLNHGEIFDDPEQDLFYIVNRHSNCPICSKYEGRVYSRSGTNPHYPSLSQAFTSIDKSQGMSLENSYLVIHPNCRHAIKPWNELAHTKKEIEEMRKKSNPATNPFDVDPRTKEQIRVYAKRQKVMAEEAASARMYRKMMQYIPVKVLGTWVSFHKHYLANDGWYEKIKAEYMEKMKDNR